MLTTVPWLKINFVIVVMVAIALTANAHSEAVSLKELESIQQQLNEKNDSLSLKFSQESFTKLRSRKTVGKGEAMFAKPDKFRWVIESPRQQSFIFNGKILKQYNPDEKTYIEYPTAEGHAAQFKQISSFLMDLKTLLETYQIKNSDKEKTTIALELEPKKKPSDIEMVELKISIDRHYVKRVKILYTNGNYWAVDFSRPRRDKLANNIFEFTPPLDVKKAITP